MAGLGTDRQRSKPRPGSSEVKRRVALRAQIGAGIEPRAYEVLAITSGEGNGLHYGPQVLQAAVPLFEGATVFIDHASFNERRSQSGGRSVRNVLGVLSAASFDATRGGVSGRLEVYPGADAAWFCALVDQYLADREAGKATPRVGLSAVLDVRLKGREVVGIERVVSVDVVVDPARGGAFVRAMNQRERGGLTHMDQEERTESTVEAQEEQRGDEGTAVAEAIVPSEEGHRETIAVQSLQTQLAALGQTVLAQRLASSHLPQPLQDLLRQRHGACGQAPDLAGLETEIEALQQAWASSLAEGGTVVRNAGQALLQSVPHQWAGWQVGPNEVDRLQSAMDRLCGLRPPSEALQGVPPVSGIRELYLMCTGDHEFRGAFDRERVALANVSTSTMTSLVKNAFNKVILDWFDQVDLWWRPIVEEEDFGSMKDLTLITLGGFGDLPTVSEGAAYTELSWSDSEEMVSFVKKGGYIGVTLEMMDQDETRKFRAIPRKIAIAGYRTLSSTVSALFSDNSGQGPYWPSSQSTYYLFDSNYGNVGSSALSASSWDATVQAMYKQAEATSSKRMGIRPAFCLVPIELEKTALTIFQSAGEPGTADNDANVRQGSARVIAVPDWTDANDWAAVADPRLAPGVVVGYRFGRVPEVYTAGEQTVGSMFTNDEMRIKARFVVAVGVGDYRPLYKHNVA